jgi:hypothetical protein
MANNLALKFVRQLKAAYPTTHNDTVELYNEKLSRWTLSAAQWDASLDYLTKNSENEYIPMLSEIYSVLKMKQSNANKFDMGWLCFESRGYCYSVRIMFDGGKWINAPMACNNDRGEIKQLQKHVGVTPALPADSINIQYVADKQDNHEEMRV